MSQQDDFNEADVLARMDALAAQSGAKPIDSLFAEGEQREVFIEDEDAIIRAQNETRDFERLIDIPEVPPAGAFFTATENHSAEDVIWAEGAAQSLDISRHAALISAPQAKAALRAREVDKVPSLVQWMARDNGQYAPVVRDEYWNFSDIFSKAGDFALGLAAAPDRLKQGVFRAITEIDPFLLRLQGMGAGILNDADPASFGRNILHFVATGEFRENVRNEGTELAKFRDAMLYQAQLRSGEIADDPTLNLPREMQTPLADDLSLLASPEYLAFQGGQAAGQIAQMLGLAAATGGGAAVAGALGGAMESTSLYADLMKDGVSPQNALSASLGFGIASGGLNRIGVDRMLGSSAGQGALRRIGGAALASLTEGITEYAEEPTEALIGGLARGLTAEELTASVMKSLRNIDVIPGAILAGGSINMISNAYAKVENAERFAAQQEALYDAVQAANATRSAPGIMENGLNFVLGNAQGSIAARDVLTLHQSSVPILEKFGWELQDVEEASALGQDLRYSQARALTILQREEMAAFRTYARPDAEGYSLAESAVVDDIVTLEGDALAERFEEYTREQNALEVEMSRIRGEIETAIKSVPGLNMAVERDSTDEEIAAGDRMTPDKAADLYMEVISRIANLLARHGISPTERLRDISYQGLVPGPNGRLMPPEEAERMEQERLVVDADESFWSQVMGRVDASTLRTLGYSPQELTKNVGPGIFGNRETVPEFDNLAMELERKGLLPEGGGADALWERLKQPRLKTQRRTRTKKSVNNRGMFDSSNPGILYQGGEGTQFSDRLVAVHNLSAENLLAASALGGLPVPSIGITKADTPFSDFGEISLIGTRDMVDPAGTPVFSFDAYSARFPEVSWAKVAAKKAQSFLDSIRQHFHAADDSNYYEIRDNITNRADRDRAIEVFIRSDGARIMFLAEQGIDFEPVTKETQESDYGSMSEPVQALVVEKVNQNFQPGDETHKRISKAYEQYIELTVEKKDAMWAKRYRKLLTERLNEDGNGILPYHLADKLIRSAYKDSSRIGKQELDSIATRDALRERVPEKDSTYISWATEKLSPLFTNPTIMIGKKKAPLTLENVVKAMTSKSIENKEDTMTFGPGKVKAAMSKRFRSMKELQADRDRVVSSEQEREWQDSIDGILEAFRTAVIPAYTVKNYRGEIDTWSGLDDSMRAIAAAINNGGNEQAVRNALSRYHFKAVAPDSLRRGVEAITALREGVTDYFEAKPQRAVMLNEFAGAVVPENTSAEVLSILENAGLKIEKYASGKDSQQEAATRLAKFLAAERDDILFQYYEEESDPLGSVRFSDDQTTVQLFQKANLSTILHETAHIFQNEIEYLIDNGFADEQLIQDYTELVEWAGGSIGAPLTTSQREKFAVGMELYFREGKAPSKPLESPFARFKKWLTRIYKDVRQLQVDGQPVELTDDVRAVFDRLLATDIEIARVSNELKIAELERTDMDALGLSPADRAYYSGLKTSLNDAANARLRELRDASRQEQLKTWSRQAREQVEKERVFIAKADIRKSGMDIDAIRAEFGDDVVTRLGRKVPGGIKSGDTVEAPETIAGRNGYASVSEMVSDILDSPNRRQRQQEIIRDKQIEHDAEFSAEEAFFEVQASADVLMHLSRILADRTGILNESEQALAGQVERENAEREEIRDTARKALTNAEISLISQQRLGAMRVGDAIRSHVFRQYAKRAMDRERIALRSQDWREAFRQNEIARINTEMARQSAAYAKQLSDLRSRGKKFVAMKKGDPDARFMVADMMARHGMDVGRDNLQRLEEGGRGPDTFTSWISGVAEQGFDVFLDAQAAAGVTPWGEMTTEQMDSLAQSVQQIIHVERAIRTARVKGERLDREEYHESIADSIRTRNKALPSNMVADNSKFWSNFRKAAGWLTKVEILCIKLDGKRNGPLWNALYKPISDAEDRRGLRMGVEREKLLKLYNIYDRDELSQMDKQVFNIHGLGETISRENMLAIALNMGNRDNRERMLGAVMPNGKTMSRDVLYSILSNMTEKDARFVQSVWDYLETFKAESFTLEEKINGLRPKDVKAEPFALRLKGGGEFQFRGGYYPIAYDTSKSADADRQSEEKSKNEMFGTGFGASARTAQGHLQARTKSGVTAPLITTLDVIQRHIQDVVTDITMRESVMDASRIIRAKSVRSSIISVSGKEVYDLLLPWLRRTVREDPKAPGENLAARLRGNLSAMAMGWKIGTAVLQISGLSVSAGVIGPQWLIRGMREVYGGAASNVFGSGQSIMRTFEIVAEQSPFMAGRLKNQIREMREFNNEMLNNRHPRLDWFRRNSFGMISYTQMAVVDLPTWVGAQARFLSENTNSDMSAAELQAESVAYADQAVRLGQGSGKASDMATIQNSSEFFKMTTAFYSWFSSMYNLMSLRKMEATGAWQRGDRAQAAGIAANFLFTAWLGTQALEIMLEGLRDRWPDEDKNEEWNKYLVGKFAGFWAGMFPGIRNVRYGKKGFEVDFIATDRGFDIGANTANALWKYVSDIENQSGKKSAIGAIRTVGYVTGLPLEWAAQITQSIWDYADETKPEIEFRKLLLR